jgi:LPXTG-site transpeptidase (sortase) family protein
MTDTHDTHTKDAMTHETLRERIVFFFVAMGVITLTFGVLFVFDFLPEKPQAGVIKDTQIETIVEEMGEESESMVAPLPRSIHFDALDREVTIYNPESADVATLDSELLKGVVRHPNSADFANTGTIFLLGHSSYLPVVNNKSFQAFNGIQKLKWGDTIRLRSSDREYVYSVDRVYEAKTSHASVAIQYETAKLILATCNSFGDKEDRFIVEATLVASHLLK